MYWYVLGNLWCHRQDTGGGLCGNLLGVLTLEGKATDLANHGKLCDDHASTAPKRPLEG